MMRRISSFGDIAETAQLEQELDDLLENAAQFTSESRFLREELRERLLDDGWVSEIRLGNSNLRLGYKRGEIGLCIQLGNVCRFHSDLLKFAYLYRAGVISSGVFVVPSDDYSRELGSNHASFSKCERDIELFQEVVGMPILLMDIDGGAK
jgi:hypothetical protein